jgi:hypothetical protein
LSSDDNYYFHCTLNYCCTIPLPSDGSGNFSAEPKLASLSHLSAGSPCRGAGNAAYATGVDVDGEPWAAPPSVGCDEYWSGSVTGAVTVAIQAAYTNVAVGFAMNFQGLIAGRVSASRWDFGDGVVVSNRPYATHAWSAAGDYAVELRAYSDSYPAGVAAIVVLHVTGQAVYYVALDSVTPVPPYTSWATAATSIQDAVDGALVGGTVLVSNGVYQTGARAVYGMSNRVAVTKPVTVQSVNGPAVTTIAGYQVPGTINGAAAVRCVYLTNGAVLAGFTLTNGATQTSGDYYTNQSGGGVWCEPTGAIVANCVLRGNSACQGGGGAYYGTFNNCTLAGNAATNGGGAYGGTLNNCTLTGNSASDGGGAFSCLLSNCTLTANSALFRGGAANGGTVNNCTLMGNSAQYGGGAMYSTLNNCMLAGNSASSGGGVVYGSLANCTLTGNSAFSGGGAVYSWALNNCIVYYNTAVSSGDNYLGYADYPPKYCCTTPFPTNGWGNFTNEPQLASFSHLSAGSPCRGAGYAFYTTGFDLDGEPWAKPPSVGCDEYWSGSVTGAVSVAIQAYTNVAVGFEASLQALIGGRVSASRWDFGDGVVVSNRPYATHTWSTPGDYVVELRAWNESNPGGVAVSLVLHVGQPVQYVALNSATPVPPYTSWATAATNIQDAVDAATVPGTLVLVSNGVYQSGARAVYGMSNRVAVTKPLTVQSLNGPAVTTIAGYRVPGTTYGDAAVRCVYLTNGAVLAGFTLANGATQASSDLYTNRCGGGVWSESASAVVTNCVLTGSAANYEGGGACSGTLNNCLLTGNLAINDGGGAYYATLNNCTLTGNTAYGDGGGACSGTLNNCTLMSNSAQYGGGAYGATLNNCTLTGNSASGLGGGASAGSFNNCIVYYNTAPTGPNYIYYDSTFNYSCTTPLPSSGTGNLTSEPLFVNTNAWSNLRLLSNSPCINAGNNAYVVGATDLDGRPRIVNGTVDLGAYEFQPNVSGLFLAWLQSYGLPTDGSADYTDSDQDGMNNWQEWVAGTVPTNAASSLRLQRPVWVPSSVTLTWSSVTNRSYDLERATNLGAAPAFSLLRSNIAGLPGTTSFTDTNALGSAARFYRVRVEN